MSEATVNVGTTPTELPRGSATALSFQNQSAACLVRVAKADTAPDPETVAGALLKPMDHGRYASLGGSDKVWAWIAGRMRTAPVMVERDANESEAPIWVQQEA